MNLYLEMQMRVWWMETHKSGVYVQSAGIAGGFDGFTAAQLGGKALFKQATRGEATIQSMTCGYGLRSLCVFVVSSVITFCNNYLLLF